MVLVLSDGSATSVFNAFLLTRIPKLYIVDPYNSDKLIVNGVCLHDLNGIVIGYALPYVALSSSINPCGFNDTTNSSVLGGI